MIRKRAFELESFSAGDDGSAGELIDFSTPLSWEEEEEMEALREEMLHLCKDLDADHPRVYGDVAVEEEGKGNGGESGEGGRGKWGKWGKGKAKGKGKEAEEEGRGEEEAERRRRGPKRVLFSAPDDDAGVQ